MTILSFCAECGALLEKDKGNESYPRCDNCNAYVKERHQRCEGDFDDEDASKLMKATFA